MIFVISASNSIEIDVRERNLRQKSFFDSWGNLNHKKTLKSQISKFQLCKKIQKDALINT